MLYKIKNFLFFSKIANLILKNKTNITDIEILEN
jgi:hypothetical protein